MPELIDIFTKIAPNASAGIWTGVLMFAAYVLKEWRETRKLSADDRLARREGYAKQVEMLMQENRELHGDLAKLRHEQDAYRAKCQEENAALARQILRMETDNNKSAIEIASLRGTIGKLERRLNAR